MSINHNTFLKVEEMVETYINGNVSDFKRWLKKANKKDVIMALQILGAYYYEENQRTGYEKAVRVFYHYLIS